VTSGGRDFTVPFPFLSPDDVGAATNGVVVEYEWLTASQLRIITPMVDGSLLTISRRTPIQDPAVVFQNGAVLTSEDLNTAALQLLYKQQEIVSLYEGSLLAARVRIATGGAFIETDPAAVADALATLILENEVLDRFRAALADIELNAAGLIASALGRFDLSIEQLRTKTAADILQSEFVLETLERLKLTVDLEVVKTFLAPSGPLDARILSLAASVVAEDTATAETLDLIGARTLDSTAFILDVNKVLVSPSESIGTRFTALDVRSAESRALITAETSVRITEDAALSLRVQSNEAALGEAAGRLLSEETTRAEEDLALSSRMTLAEASVSSSAAAILSESSARATAETALGTRIDSIVATIIGEGTATSAEVIAEELARVDADSALGSRIDTVTATAVTNAAAAQALVTAESTARATGDGALGIRVDNVSATFQAADAVLSAAILDEATARTSADLAEASARSILAARTGQSEADIIQERAVRAAADSAFSSTVSLLGAKSGGGEAFVLNLNTVQVSPGVTLGSQTVGILSRLGATETAVVTETNARINADSAFASQLTVVQSTVGSLTSSVSALSTAVNGVSAAYALKLNVNGFITGYVQTNTGTEGSFTILADRFAIVDPNSGPGGTPETVFEVVDGLTRIRNQVIGIDNITTDNIAPNGVQTGNIGDSAVTTPNIQPGAVTGPAAVSGSSTIAFGNTAYQNGQEVTIANPTGAPVIIQANASMLLVRTSARVRCRVRLFQGGTGGPVSQGVIAYEELPANILDLNTPTAGVPATYRLEFQIVSGSTSGELIGTLLQTLIVTEYKR
jgi:hypothetical protein